MLQYGHCRGQRYVNSARSASGLFSVVTEQSPFDEVAQAALHVVDSSEAGIGSFSLAASAAISSSAVRPSQSCTIAAAESLSTIIPSGKTSWC